MTTMSLNNRRHDIAKVFRRRDQLMKALSPVYANADLAGATFSVFVDDVCQELPSACKAEAVAHSLFEFVGSSPTAKELFHTFWRLAGNVKSLCDGVAVHPWNEQKEKEWIPVQIVDVCSGRLFEKPVYGITVQILLGGACPLRMYQKWSPKKMFYLAQYRFEDDNGFMFSRRVGSRSRRVPKYIFEHAKQLYGLRFLALIDPLLSEDGPFFKEIRFTPSLSVYNRDLIKRRARLEDPYYCPKGFGALTPCHKCYYGRKDCPMACHSKTYIEKLCPSCEVKSYFDPQDSVTMFCVNCTDTKRRRGEVH